jgi:hypothetical protein
MSPIHHHHRRTNKRIVERLRFATFRVKCFLWTENHQNGPFSGFGFAGDVSETGVGIYTDFRLKSGTLVRIALEEESSDTYQGMVAWCQRYSLEQRFLGQQTQDHRLGIQLIFESEPERQRYLIQLGDLRKRASSLTGGYKF